jgi:hypothetical protein
MLVFTLWVLNEKYSISEHVLTRLILRKKHVIGVLYIYLCTLNLCTFLYCEMQKFKSFSVNIKYILHAVLLFKLKYFPFYIWQKSNKNNLHFNLIYTHVLWGFLWWVKFLFVNKSNLLSRFKSSLVLFMLKLC